MIYVIPPVQTHIKNGIHITGNLNFEIPEPSIETGLKCACSIFFCLIPFNISVIKILNKNNGNVKNAIILSASAYTQTIIYTKIVINVFTDYWYMFISFHIEYAPSLFTKNCAQILPSACCHVS